MIMASVSQVTMRYYLLVVFYHVLSAIFTLFDRRLVFIAYVLLHMVDYLR